MKCRNEYPSARDGTTSPMAPEKGKVVKLEATAWLSTRQKRRAKP